MASIDRHGNAWRVRMCVKGQRHTIKYDGDLDLSVVEAMVDERERNLRGQYRKGLSGPVRFSALVVKYEQAGMPGKRKHTLTAETKRSYRTSLQAFRSYFVEGSGDPFVHDIHPPDVEGFKAWRYFHDPEGGRLKDAVSDRTVAKDRAVLHRLFAWGRTMGHVSVNPVEATEAPKGDEREYVILDESEYEALLDACAGRPMLWLYTLVLAETGLRCDSEALWLRWQDVDLDGGLLTVETVRKGRRTKSGKARRVPLTPRVRVALAEHMAAYRMRTYGGERSPWIFHHEVDRRHAKAGERITGLRRAFGNAAERAGLPGDLRQHDLRHRRVTTWLAEGRPIALVAKAMGHSTVKVTEKYEHLVDRHLLALVDEPTDVQLRALVAG
jgi:integrase